jgi:2-polyprenyl-3-methyl-5-hydroxy-6-metoxy-1,4-benzoquinol methylase
LGNSESSGRVVHAIPGTHELVVRLASQLVAPGDRRALDLGAGSGALAELLQRAGFEVVAADVKNYFELMTEFVQADFDDPSFDRAFNGKFELITSVEVIEHLENPIGFLRAVRRLLKDTGIAILTTPNVDNVAARLKFFVNGKLRLMDELAPAHIMPIHFDLLVRQWLPRAGLQLVQHHVFPEGDFPLTSRRYFIPLLRFGAAFLRGPSRTGDTHILILRPN